jgi:RND family efflux transporter MFP subunit
MPGQEMFRLVDLSGVWVEASLYEIDAARVALGDEARLALAYDPTAARAGRVSYVYPEIDSATRTLRVRFDVVNPRLDWKPGMFVDVELAGRPREALVVPDEAVLDTGERRLVFVEAAPGRFEPREVTVGERRGGDAEILAGLEAGERVAIRANFLLDSESRLRAALSARAARAATPAPPGAGHEGHR